MPALQAHDHRSLQATSLQDPGTSAFDTLVLKHFLQVWVYLGRVFISCLYRADGKVTYGYSLVRGKRFTMEDCVFAKVCSG